jgi:cytochrome bd-type quinol oxidase subunit 2
MDFKKLHKGNFNVIGSSPCRCTEHLQNYIGLVSLTILILGYLCTVCVFGFFHMRLQQCLWPDHFSHVTCQIIFILLTYSMWPKVLPHVKKKSLYNQPKPYFFKKLL